MTRAWIGLGANLGDRVAALDRSLEQLEASGPTRVVARSGNYRTPPWGDVDQPEFLNAVAVVETAESADELLATLHGIEADMGRERDNRRWGPRVIDLDLLLFADERIERPGLQVPHPRIRERAFVLVPMAELDGTLVVPGQGRVDQLLAMLDAAERAAVRPGPEPGFRLSEQARSVET